MGPTLLVRMPSVPPRISSAGVVDLDDGSAARPSEECDETVGQRDQLQRQSRLLGQRPPHGPASIEIDEHDRVAPPERHEAAVRADPRPPGHIGNDQRARGTGPEAEPPDERPRLVIADADDVLGALPDEATGRRDGPGRHEILTAGVQAPHAGLPRETATVDQRSPLKLGERRELADGPKDPTVRGHLDRPPLPPLGHDAPPTLLL